MRSTTSPSPLLFCLVITGCGAGTAAEAVRPQEQTANSALGESGECRDVSRGAEPLVVDWKPEQRGELEVAMKDGVAIVAYDCNGIRLLTDCKLDGEYGFIGMTRKEQVVRLESMDEVKANLPFSGGAVGGELQRGATLDVAMILVGKRRTTWREPSRQDLAGSCDGATHYVRGAMVGAFAMETGTHAKVRAAADLFLASASGASEASRGVKNKDGDPKDCEKALPDAESPPPQCGAPVRLALAPILPAPAEKPPEAATAPVAVADEPSCPEGLVEIAGKCGKPEANAPYQCAAGSKDDCTAQCDRGHAGSCGTLGEILLGASDVPGARTALKKACDGQVGSACGLLGHSLGKDPAPDPAAAVAAFESGCNLADAPSCAGLARSTKDAAKATQLFERACEGGDAPSCAEAARVLAAAPETAPRALELHERACRGFAPASCDAVGVAYETGTSGVGKNPIIAEMQFRRGCIQGSAPACTNLGRMILGKPAGGNADDARMQFQRACVLRDVLGCAALKVLYGDQRPVMPDVMQKQALQRSCTAGSARDCASSGLLDAASGMTPPAKMSLQRACTMGDKFGCKVQEKVK